MITLLTEGHGGGGLEEVMSFIPTKDNLPAGSTNAVIPGVSPRNLAKTSFRLVQVQDASSHFEPLTPAPSTLEYPSHRKVSERPSAKPHKPRYAETPSCSPG